MPRIGRSRPVSNYKDQYHYLQPVNATVALTTPNVALAAPLPSVSAGATVALTTPNVALAAPLLTPGLSVSLTTPNIALAAPVPTIMAGANVILTAPNVALAAPLLAPSANISVNLTTPNIALYAPPVVAQVILPFPFSPLDAECELFLNSTWTNVTPYVYQRTDSSPKVNFERGKPNESGTTNPSSAAWEWNNRDGRFSPRNPTGPYYKQLIRNTSVRWSVPAFSTYMRLEANNSDRAFVNDNATIDISGSIEMRIQLRLTDWQGGILAEKWDGGGCWYWQLNADGTLTFAWNDSSVVFHSVKSNIPVPFTTNDFALRVTMDATTGNVTFYTGTTIGGSFTQLGIVQSGTGGASTTIRVNHTSALVVGWSANLTPAQILGRIYDYKLYNGIGGTTAAEAFFDILPVGTTTWFDSQSNAWSLGGGAEINNRDYRYHGQMSAQPPTWDKTGVDQSVQATAGGPLRLIQASTANVASTLYRGITSQTGTNTPVAYWPMQDGSDAKSYGPAIGPYTLNWGGPPNPLLASNTDFIGSAPLPALNNTSTNGLIQNYTGAPWNGTGAAWSVQFVAEFKTLPATGSASWFQVDAVNGAAAVYILLGIDSSGNLIINAYDDNLNVVATSGSVSFGNIQQPCMYTLAATQSGSNVAYSLSVVPIGSSSGGSFTVTTSSTGVPGFLWIAYITPFGGFTDLVFGHLAIYSVAQSAFTQLGPFNAWAGEAAAVRFARLCKENGWQARILGPSLISALMGPQSINTLSTLLDECETADMGQLFEPREQLALGYRTLASLLNQTAALPLSYSAANLGGAGEDQNSGLALTYDDLLTKNDWTLTLGNSTSTGTSYRAYLNDGSELSVSVVGSYATSETINLFSNTQLPDAAWWLVHLGTVNEARWAAIPLNLARSALSALQTNIVEMDIGDSTSITSIPTTISYDPVGQLMIGFTEQLGSYYWWVTPNCEPSSPYNTGIYDDPVYGRADTDGSTLTNNITAVATSFQVTTTTSTTPIWTTAAADFPFDINIGGERMTVSNITGSSSPQTFTISARSVNGVVKTHNSGDDVRLWTPPIYAPI